MRVALVHEFLTQYGGAERVLDCFLEIWPKAHIYTLIYDKDKMGQFYGKFKIKTSYLQNFPAPRPARYKWWLAFYPNAIEKFDFSGYDLVVSDSSAFAKGVITHEPTKHICYILTPTRYLWSVTKEYLHDAPVPFYIKPIMPLVLGYLRRWDYGAAQRPDRIIADSQNIAKNIKKFYHRSSDAVIFPPVDTKKFYLKDTKRDYWLVVGRQEPYKKTDLAIEAANKLKINLVVAGSGTKFNKLMDLAGPTIKFAGRVSDKKLAELYSGCIGLIFPQEEDAGITPLEAMASGRPVIAYNAGGARETVVAGVTGEFFEEQTTESLCEAIKKFNFRKYDPVKIRKHAQIFSKYNFTNKIKKFIRNYK